MLCAFHNVALASGEAWALRDGHGDLLMGADLGLEVLGFSFRQSVNHQVLELKLGQHGVETETVMMRRSPRIAKQICDTVAGQTHPDAFDSSER